jgi:hypothetical protein
MAREVPRNQPLSDEDREYLHARGYHDMVDAIDRDHPGGGTPSEVTDGSAVSPDEVVIDDDEDEYEDWTGPQLEAELKRRNLPYTGTKDQRIERLRADDDEADGRA